MAGEFYSLLPDNSFENIGSSLWLFNPLPLISFPDGASADSAHSLKVSKDPAMKMKTHNY